MRTAGHRPRWKGVRGRQNWTLMRIAGFLFRGQIGSETRHSFGAALSCLLRAAYDGDLGGGVLPNLELNGAYAELRPLAS